MVSIIIHIMETLVVTDVVIDSERYLLSFNLCYNGSS